MLKRFKVNSKIQRDSKRFKFFFGSVPSEELFVQAMKDALGPHCWTPSGQEKNTSIAA